MSAGIRDALLDVVFDVAIAGVVILGIGWLVRTWRESSGEGERS